MHEILGCLCLFLLIMIDWKLTLSGLWWTAYLFVWMGRRRAGLVLLLAWWLLEDRGATSSICFWSLSLGLWLGCRLVFILTLVYVVEFLPICRDLEILVMMYIDLMTCIFSRCMTYICCDCWEFYICMLLEFWCEDVASISWIYVLFSYFIALI
jgi:hypothetical protein